MSIAIQKKKFSQKKPLEYSQQLSQFGKNDTIHQQYLKTLSDFEVNFKKSCSQATLKNLKTVLEGFYKVFKADEFFLTDLSKYGEYSANETNVSSENVLLFNRASEVVNMLADYVVNKRSILIRNRRSFDLLEKISFETRDVILLCVKILKLFAIINIQFAVMLSNKPNFCIKMFELMLQDNKIYFKQVLGIQEALIAANPQITEKIYPHMYEALVGMSKKYFARFSRIVALFVLESSEKVEFKELPYNYTENKAIKVHSFLLSVPDLIETYAMILEYLKDVTERLITTNSENVRKTIRFFKETNLLKDSGLNLSYLKPVFEQSQISENLITEIFSPKFIIKFVVKKSNLTEILFVISNLLSGKRKFEVQNKLSQINFLEKVVNPLFDLLFHPELNSGNSDDSFFTEDCSANSPLATTRIQLLRIIINFCDRDSPNTLNKDLLLSAEEKNILYKELIPNLLRAHHPNFSVENFNSKDTKKISELISQINLKPNDSLEPFFNDEILEGNAFDKVEKKGLLNKIIILFNNFHPNSNYRFWLASCVEAFLRGFNECHQIFVAHSGLLFNLLKQILTKQITKSSNVQISYDLIGEIMKFNRHNISFIENICLKYDWMSQLADHALVNVVDSNVFLRALLLSFERFDFQYKNQQKISEENLLNFNENSKMYRRFSKEDKNSFLLVVDSVNANFISQDNICCINTILIMTIFADQRGELKEYINSLTTREDKTTDQIKQLLENFDEVLAIWNRYYMSKAKDSFSLQYTSSLPFSYFQTMRQKLQDLIKEHINHLENTNDGRQ